MPFLANRRDATCIHKYDAMYSSLIQYKIPFKGNQ